MKNEAAGAGREVDYLVAFANQNTRRCDVLDSSDVQPGGIAGSICFRFPDRSLANSCHDFLITLGNHRHRPRLARRGFVDSGVAIDRDKLFQCRIGSLGGAKEEIAVWSQRVGQQRAELLLQ